MDTFELTVNGEVHTVDADPSMPLLWVLRDRLGLTGSKFGCGIGVCGACTVRMDGSVTRSCVFPVSACVGRDIQTIEGVSENIDHPVQRAWIEEQVPQCGYCQSGMIMAALALLEHTTVPTDAEIDAAITNLCRCGTYPRVRRAIHRAARLMSA